LCHVRWDYVNVSLFTPVPAISTCCHLRFADVGYLVTPKTKIVGFGLRSLLSAADLTIGQFSGQLKTEIYSLNLTELKRLTYHMAATFSAKVQGECKNSIIIFSFIVGLLCATSAKPRGQLSTYQNSL